MRCTADPVRATPQTLAADFNCWCSELFRWQTGAAAYKGRVVVSNATRVHSTMPLMVERCPTAALANAFVGKRLACCGA